jgi:hypothetical protein
MRTMRHMTAAQAARDKLIAAHYANPAAMPFGGPRRGAPDIAGMHADREGGRLSPGTCELDHWRIRAAVHVLALARRMLLTDVYQPESSERIDAF